MAIELPSWVPEFEDEYVRFKKKDKFRIIGLILIIIPYLAIFSFNEIIKNNNILSSLFGVSITVGMVLFAGYSNRKLPSASKYLASMVYSVGFHLEKNSDPESNHYITKMDSYLKNCDAIIKKINVSLRGATYVNNTRDYLKKLKQMIELLNEYYINYPKYSIDKSMLSKKIIQLADIIHRDKGYVTPEHLNLINSLVDDLRREDIKEKPLYVSKIKGLAPMLKTRWGGLPDSLKLIIYIIIVFFITYEFITYVALTKGIPQETTFGYAVGGSIAALVPALMIKDYILK